MKFFKDTFDEDITWHINHQYSPEMSKKSVVVSSYIIMKCYLKLCVVGVILKNENKANEMIDILSELHQYIPSFDYGENLYELPSGHSLKVPQTKVKRILIGGDKLTAARVRGERNLEHTGCQQQLVLKG